MHLLVCMCVYIECCIWFVCLQLLFPHKSIYSTQSSLLCLMAPQTCLYVCVS